MKAAPLQNTMVFRYPENYPDVEILFIGSNIAADRGAVIKDAMSVSQELYNAYWKRLEQQPFFQVGKCLYRHNLDKVQQINIQVGIP